MSRKWGYALIGLGILGIASTAKAKPKGRRPFRGDLGPVTDDPTQVDDTICVCSEDLAGYTGDVAGALLECVAVRIFPDVPWPPTRRDHRSMRAWWEFMALRIVIFMEDPEGFCEGVPPDDGRMPVPPEPAPVNFQEIPSNHPGYPWEIPSIHLGGDGSHAPTPGTFYILDDEKASLGLPTQMASVARAALASGLAMAGADPDLIDDAQLRLAMKDLIVCGPWNDAAYGTTKQSAAGGSLGMGPHGRGLVWYPRHRDNIARLRMGQPASRNVYLNAGKISDGARQMQIWIPPLNLDLLRDGVVTTQGLTWSDGSSVLVPPPSVMALGVDTAGVLPPGGGSWGC